MSSLSSLPSGDTATVRSVANDDSTSCLTCVAYHLTCYSKLCHLDGAPCLLCLASVPTDPTARYSCCRVSRQVFLRRRLPAFRAGSAVNCRHDPNDRVVAAAAASTLQLTAISQLSRTHVNYITALTSFRNRYTTEQVFRPVINDVTLSYYCHHNLKVTSQHLISS